MVPAAPAVVWFRRDLRVTDHAPLLEAAAAGPVVCVYFLDERRWLPDAAPGRQLACPRVGPHRTRFLLESLVALRERLRECAEVLPSGELLLALDVCSLAPALDVVPKDNFGQRLQS